MADRTFSDADVIRIFRFHLTPEEQERVRHFFTRDERTGSELEFENFVVNVVSGIVNSIDPVKLEDDLRRDLRSARRVRSSIQRLVPRIGR